MENYTLTGVLAKDCEVRFTESGKHIINFSIAENKAWKDKNGVKQERTKWINCVWWNDSDAIPQYLLKGMRVAIVGEPEASAYVDKEGKAVAKLECKVLSLAFLGHIKAKETQQTEATPQASTECSEQTDDLPF